MGEDEKREAALITMADELLQVTLQPITEATERMIFDLTTKMQAVAMNKAA